MLPNGSFFGLPDTISVPSGVNSVTVRLIRDGAGVANDVVFNEIAFFDDIALTPVGSFTAPTVILEPSVLILLASGLFSIIFFKRRSQS